MQVVQQKNKDSCSLKLGYKWDSGEHAFVSPDGKI